MSIQLLCPFFNWVVVLLLLSCRSSLYILDINTLLDARFRNIFFHYIDFPFCLLTVSLDAWNFEFWCSLICIFFICFLCFWWHIEGIIAKSNVTKLFSCVSNRVRKGPSSFFCKLVYSFPNTYCWRYCPFPLSGLGIFVKGHLTTYWIHKAYFWAL